MRFWYPLTVADPENTLGVGGGGIICGRRPPVSSNGTLGVFLLLLGEGGPLVPPLDPPLVIWWILLME